MKQNTNKINRRDFLRTTGALGLSSIIASGAEVNSPNEPNTSGQLKKPEFPQVPRRKLGKTGVDVPCLSLGCVFNALDNRIILIKALQYGVNLWDTAQYYEGGNSELGIGKFLLRNPEARKKLFIVTKPLGGPKTPEDLEKSLQQSLKRMNTDYIDLYYGFKALYNPKHLTDELKQWAQSAKKRKLIRFFGFCTHANMAKCLAGAAKLDWIDAIMTSYNFRLMQDPEMQAGIEACYKAGIGLIAMKTLTMSTEEPQKIETENDKKLAEHFLQKGYTKEQAKIKIVLQDKRISSACVGRGNLSHFLLNVAAALDKTKLSKKDMGVFKDYAHATRSSYCAGCANICNSTTPDAPCVSEIMRALMYYNSYQEPDAARAVFAEIPAGIRNKLSHIDYSLAEEHCPQHMPIGKLVHEAVSKLA